MASVAAPNALGVMDQHGRRARVGRNYRGHGAFAGRMAAAAESVHDVSRSGYILRGAVWTLGGDSGVGSIILRVRFFFVDPRYEFTISEPHEFFSLIVFLVVAVITAMLASRARERSLGLGTRVQAAQSMFEFSRKLSGAAKLTTLFGLPPSTRRRLSARDALCC